MGYLVPVRDGPGLLPNRESCWDAVAAAVTWKLRLTFWPESIFGVFKLDFDSYESSWNFDTVVLHRISSRIYLAE